MTVLDTTEVTDPNGIRELNQELFYDDELKGVFNRVDGDLEFHGDGYDYIEDIILTQGICSKIELSLILASREYFKGLIHIVDISDWNATREIIKTPVSDNNLSSYVFNNKNVQAYVNADKTKSGLPATAATPVTGFELFTPSTGSYDFTRDFVYRVDDVFNFIVEFVSDGNMTYSSPFFGSGGDMENLMCASALHLSTDAEKTPYLSLYGLFTELDKIFNLSMYIDYSGELPNLVVDKTDNLYSDDNLLTLDDVKDVSISFDKEKMYAFVDIGSSQYQNYNGGTFTMPDANFLGFKEEKYYIIGQCNLDRGINLVNDYVIDSNAIEDMLVNQNDSFDGSIVFIESDGSQATKYDNLSGFAGSIYNQSLNNYNKSINYLGAIPNDMVKYISNDENNSDASKNTPYSLSNAVIIHNTENSDPGNNYDPVLGRYTCGAGNGGSYSFTFNWTGLSYSGALGFNAGSVKIQHYNSGGTLLEEQTIKSFTHNIVIIDFGGASGSFMLDDGDYVVVYGVQGLSANTSFSSSDFLVNYIDVEGGTFQTYDPDDYKVFSINCVCPLTISQFMEIRDNPTKTITLNTRNKSFVGWVKSIKRNIVTGMSNITLRSSNSKIQSR